MIGCLILSQYLFSWPLKLTDNIFLFWLGIILIVVGFLFWIYVIHYMRVKGGLRMENKNLLTVSPFKYIRHPMYVSCSFVLVGVGVLFSTWVWFVVL